MNKYVCPVCDSKNIDIFIEIPDIPVYCNLLFSSRREAINAPRSDIRLGFCNNCTHVYNYAFDPDLIDYTLDYENSLQFSPRFQEYATQLAADLVKRHQLYNKDIIEIGCGDGDFLALLCELGNNRGLGFDPSHVPDLDSTGYKKNITFIRDYYSEHFSHYTADMICCRHLLEHIQYPCDFLGGIRQTVNNYLNTTLFFEVPNALFTFRDLGIWDLIYEHCSYFSEGSLAYLFNACGFEIKKLSETFAGQFLCIECLPMSNQPTINTAFRVFTEKMVEYVEVFAEKYYSKVKQWQLKLNRMEEDKKNVVVWGAGSKGATFLNVLLPARSLVKYVVDVNPRKQGKYVSGSGQKIVSPDSIREYQPDVICVMNPIYSNEIQKMINGMNLRANLVSVI